MAQMTLGAVGSAFGGPILGAAGSAAGSYVDQKWLYPEINRKFRKTERYAVEGPRVQSIQIQGVAEGEPVPFFYGTRNRVAGQIIFLSDLIEHKKVSITFGTSSGGKGGNTVSTATTEFSYSVDVAVAAGEGEIEEWVKIVADGRTLWEKEQTFEVTSNQMEIESFEEPNPNDIFNNLKFLRITSNNPAKDVSIFRSGVDLSMSGWSNSPFNDTFEVVSSAYDENTLTSEVVVSAPGLSGSEGIGATVTLTQDLPEFADKDLDSISLYRGTLDQSVDPMLESRLGIGQTPAFRGIAYAAITNLRLQQYGNRLPQFSAVTNKQTDHKVNEIIPEILERAGLAEAQYNVDEIPDLLVCRGLLGRGPQSAVTMLQPLLTAYNILVRETQGRFEFVIRGEGEILELTSDDLAAHEKGSDTARPATFRDTMPLDLPSEVNVRFIEERFNFAPAMQKEVTQNPVTSNVVNISVPIVMSASEARAIARRELWTPRANLRSIELSLPPNRIVTQENDLLKFTHNGQDFTVLTRQVDRGQNFQIQVQGSVEYIPTNDQPGIELVIDPGPAFTIFIAGTLVFELIDVAPFSNNEKATPGIYYCVAKYDPTADFASADIFQSGDGQNFRLVDNQVIEGTVGLVEGPRFPYGRPGIIDKASSVTICLREGTLSSVTDLELLNGANQAIIGNEVIAFKNATLNVDGTYTLDTFLRGLRNTEDQVTNHDIDNERFVLLTGNPGLRFLPTDQVDTDTNQDFKAVPPGVNIGTIPSFKLQPMFNHTIKPFAPAILRGTRNGANDLTVSWFQRSRAVTKPLFQVAPIEESIEKYEIDILNVAQDTVLRTITVDDTTSAVYTAAQQTEDGYAPGAPIPVEIFQISALGFRGQKNEDIL